MEIITEGKSCDGVAAMEVNVYNGGGDGNGCAIDDEINVGEDAGGNFCVGDGTVCDENDDDIVD